VAPDRGGRHRRDLPRRVHSPAGPAQESPRSRGPGENCPFWLNRNRTAPQSRPAQVLVPSPSMSARAPKKPARCREGLPSSRCRARTAPTGCEEPGRPTESV
jgi:hypothetical protein